MESYFDFQSMSGIFCLTMTESTPRKNKKVLRPSLQSTA